MEDIKTKNLGYYLETYGCQMNEYDSELVRSILQKENFIEVDKPDSADVVLLNTCSVRENAHNKVFGRLQRLQKMKDKRPVVIGVLGCMAQNLKLDLLESSVHVDIMAGPDSYRRLPTLIRDARNGGGHASDIDLSEFETYDDIYPARKDGVNAWIAIMRGCDNFCTFCVVPYTRGRERSRPVESIRGECEKLVSEGYSQVTLLGQNVNSYDDNGRKFARLMNVVSDVPGIKRVRFTSPHPKDFPDELLDLIAGYPHLCKHIHLPLQAGSDRILDIMRRKHTAVEYLELVDRIRSKIPDVALTTDIILGFPTETREEFEETVEMVKKVEYDSAFIFNYSERKGTVAKRRWADDVSPEEKKYRIVLLNDIQKEISIKRNRRHVGQTHKILVEAPSKKNEQDWYGRNDGNKMVIFKRTDQEIGDYINVEITGATPNTLKGTAI
ncbi:MAG: tRNA (N6-isopentenyl adenosine(37)-C2)-methylthiotransferase MiaB [candidate division Zixibacteria bacterium]